jgi:hypothetical protein
MTISITNEHDEPLAGAIVTLTSGRVTDAVEIAMTGANGVAPFTEFPEGTLLMTVYADGYVTAHARVSGENGGGVGVALKRAQ